MMYLLALVFPWWATRPLSQFGDAVPVRSAARSFVQNLNEWRSSWAACVAAEIRAADCVKHRPISSAEEKDGRTGSGIIIG